MQEEEKKQDEKDGNITSIKELNSILKKRQEGEWDQHLLYARLVLGVLQLLPNSVLPAKQLEALSTPSLPVRKQKTRSNCSA